MKSFNSLAVVWIIVFWLAQTTVAQALPWTQIVETLALRAEGAEVRDAGEKVTLRNGEAASEILVSTPLKTPDEATWALRFDRLKGVDDTLKGQWRALAVGDRRLALELAEGSQHVLTRYPGESGLLILQNLDADGLALSRAYGDHVIDGMEWIESPEVLEALGKDAAQSATAWKSAVRKAGSGGGAFWRDYVAPHKAKWLAGGALAAYLAAPDKFHDQLGRLTSHGATELGRLLGDAALGGGNGLLAGIGASIKGHFAAAPIRTALTLMVIASLLLVALPFGQTLPSRLFTLALRCAKAFRPTAARRHVPQRE